MIDYEMQLSVIDAILKDEIQPRYIPKKTEPIEVFAKGISQAIFEIKKVLPNVSFYCEPGRYICHDSMHMLFRLMDLKTPQVGITDGGTNMIGWEKYQFYAGVPLFNLSQFSKTNEIPFITYGSLCTPDDIWGYYLYTKGAPSAGDILLMPYQGAYTYTLAQEFIKDIPKVYDL